MRIKDTQKVDRPREKLVKYGTKKLTDAELLAVVLRTGTKDTNVVELSRNVLRAVKSDINGLNIDKLKKIHGMGLVKSGQIVAALELARRLTREESKPQLLSPEEVYNSVKELGEYKKEHLLSIYLDVKNREITREIISVGTLTANLVHPREIFEPAVNCLAAGIIIIHNHPSGETEPSSEDIKITSQLVAAGKIMGIPILDHLIIAKTSFYSFQEHDKLT